MTQRSPRLVTVVLPEMTDAQRMKIERITASYGYRVRFFQNAEDAMEFIDGTEVLFSTSAKLAASAPNLKWQCSPSAGVNQFAGCDIFTSGKAALTCSSGAYGVTIAEHIIMLILEVFRRQQEYTQIVNERRWTRNLPVRSILRSRITILGTGDIGQTTAVRLWAFQPKTIIGVNRSGKNPKDLFDRVITTEELDTVLPQTDILILSLPGTADTAHIIGKNELGLLPDNALIVNVGRGICIDQKALEEELNHKRLYAALDVFETEPIPADDSFWECPNLLITPHVAGDTSLPYTVERIVDLFLDDFRRYAEGKPFLRPVDLGKGY